MSVILNFLGVGEQMIVLEEPCTTTAVGAGTTNTFLIPAGRTSINVSVTGFNTGALNITAVLYNIVLTQLN
jgi:hypothetical protein